MATSAKHPVHPEPTINDVEQTVQNGLEALRNAPLSNQITDALKFLTPPGYRPIAQFEEDGRKKRGTAAASNWNPETGEIVIYFERVRPSLDDSGNYIPLLTEEQCFNMPEVEMRERINSNDPRLAGDSEYHLAGGVQIQQCCEALAEAEKVGRAFIALKWFRDVHLATLDHPWTAMPEMRQAVLARAIEDGAILTSQIPNPKESVAPRFQPIQLRGDGPSASEILLRDRGRL
jgi:hypothetical protein